MVKEKTIKWVKSYNCGYTYPVIAFFSSDHIQKVYKNNQCPCCNSDLIREETEAKKEDVEI